MRSPVTASLDDIESIPDRPAVFMLWAGDRNPYLAKTALLRRRLKRVSKMIPLIDRIEYWPVGSQLESSLIHLDLAKQHFPDDWQKITRLKSPSFVRLTTDNPFPRTMISTRLGRGLFFGPFPNRAAAEKFDAEMLDLFQLRRCEENLNPSPEHPGCIYGEMNRCMRPCQQAVSQDEYRGEADRVVHFLYTHGHSLYDSTETARDRASADMQFEEAERLHQRAARINEVMSAAGELPRTLDQLAGVAIVPSAGAEAVDLWFLLGGRWAAQKTFSTTATVSMDQRLKEMTQDLETGGSPDLEHLAVLMRWYQSTWRDGEWFSFDSVEKIPYRKLVNAIGRVAKPLPTKPKDQN